MIKGYSWRAITCCVSKGLLVLVAIVAGIGAVLGAGAFSIHRHEVRCEALSEAKWQAGRLGDAEGLARATAEYEDECLPRELSELETMLRGVAAGVVGLGFAVWLLVGICSANITYCQVAVETQRRPWYWLPRWAGGDPLPPRETAKCATCGQFQPESDDAYRARVVG